MSVYNAASDSALHGYAVDTNDFTMRQQRIMMELARGSSMEAICQATGLTATSVRAMISDICLFLGTPDPAGARHWILEQLDRSERLSRESRG
jgi:DNA-binding NarL/FixJ family response regulator